MYDALKRQGRSRLSVNDWKAQSKKRDNIMTGLSVGVDSGSRAQLSSGSTRTAATTSSMMTDSKQVKWTSNADGVKDGGEAPSVEDRTPATLASK